MTLSMTEPGSCMAARGAGMQGAATAALDARNRTTGRHAMGGRVRGAERVQQQGGGRRRPRQVPGQHLRRRVALHGSRDVCMRQTTVSHAGPLILCSSPSRRLALVLRCGCERASRLPGSPHNLDSSVELLQHADQLDGNELALGWTPLVIRSASCWLDIMAKFTIFRMHQRGATTSVRLFATEVH